MKINIIAIYRILKFQFYFLTEKIPQITSIAMMLSFYCYYFFFSFFKYHVFPYFSNSNDNCLSFREYMTQADPSHSVIKASRSRRTFNCRHVHK